MSTSRTEERRGRNGARLRLPAAAVALALTAAGLPAVPAGDAPRAARELHAALEATPDTAHGARLFAICLECHGPHGEGNASGWPPQIAGQHRGVIVKELVDYRAGLRWYDPMERIAGRHVLGSTQDVADVAAYAASLNPSPDTTPGPRRGLETGAGLYVRRCQWCHGVRGEGNDARLVPRVAGQQYEYLLRQLRDTIEGRRPNMRAQHLRVIEGCTMEELMELASYMSRLDRPERS
ncbi:MAG: c-type cytochrome [Gammaproteobacteria bacterium]|nr:c-type cytochrome [Gammaproteobacteria bacterium]